MPTAGRLLTKRAARTRIAIIAAKKVDKKDDSTAKPVVEIPIAQNRRAKFEYEVLETLECGIVLVGSEVKSLRAGRLSLDEAFARVREGELWLIGLDIQEYPNAKFYGHETKRVRKLLIHKRELKKFAGKATQKSLTLVPLRMYFKASRVKVLVALCKGRKLHDKREVKKTADAKRHIDREMKNRRK